MQGGMQITLERRGHRGRYILPMPDGDTAELTFVDSGPGHIIVDHSWVPPRHRGQGVALRLVERAVADARAAGVKITPLCRYVAIEFRRHPQWSDVLKSRTDASVADARPGMPDTARN